MTFAGLAWNNGGWSVLPTTIECGVLALLSKPCPSRHRYQLRLRLICSKVSSSCALCNSNRTSLVNSTSDRSGAAALELHRHDRASLFGAQLFISFGHATSLQALNKDCCTSSLRPLFGKRSQGNKGPAISGTFYCYTEVEATG